METSERTMTSVLADKVRQAIEKRNANAVTSFQRMESQAKAMRDFVAGGSALSFTEQGGSVLAVLGPETYTLHRNALGQFAAQNNIPMRYLNALMDNTEWGRGLALDILNRHADNSPRERVLMRAVGGDLRGILSDQYRRLDSMRIIQSVMAAANKNGAVLLDAHCNDTRMFVEFLHPRLHTIQTPANGEVTIAIGFRLKNSDFGDGSLQLDAYEMQAVCLNGIVTQRLFREVHLGTKLPSDLRLSEETYRLDTQRSASLLHDAVNTLYLPDTLQKRFNTIERASATPLDLKKQVEELPRVGFNKDEAEAVEATLMRSNPDDGVTGEPSLWKFAQALGAVARDADPDRRRFIEEYSGGMLSAVDKEIDKVAIQEN